MKSATSLKIVYAIGASLLSAAAMPGALTPAEIQQSAQGTDHDVIVILRDQMPNLPAVRGARAARASALAAAQVPVLSDLQQSGATRLRSFGLINAVAATVSKAEADHLASHPLVQAVVPDAAIRAPQHRRSAASAGGSGGLGAGVAVASGTDNGLCDTLEPQALQLTNTAFADAGTPQAQQIIDGNGKPVTGQGVKVAFIADGLDPTVSGFVRPDGTNVFIDYEDFSGDPAGTPTGGEEAFGDASSIAAQDMPGGKPLTFDLSRFVSAAHPLPSPCNIRIRGMAPGASLVGLKVFSNLGYTTTSGFVQAIEWAVMHDEVDVINESFGTSYYPDDVNDPTTLANNAAVKAGVTVVVATGDGGSNGTMGSPSTDPDVIAVGATTQFRLYAQINFAAIPLSHGFTNDNIASFSSGGFSQSSARTVDVVAPGDLGWALYSTNTALFTDSTSYAANPATPIQFFGGTSESTSLTSGEVALVIQAYRSTHHGADPTPAQVKRIIQSTATDLGAPSSEQGAGLINSLAAVQAALSVNDSNGRPTAQGGSLLLAPNSANITGEPNAGETAYFTLTNTGSTAQNLTAALQMRGAPVAGATLNLVSDPAHDRTFPNVTGAPRPYIEQKFVVPANAQHLDAAIAFQSPLSNPTALVYFALLNPAGQLVAYSEPQGTGSGYAHLDAVNPLAGTWTAIVWTHPAGDPESYAGPVQFTWSAERLVTLGSVSPASFALAPGASRTLTANFTLPAQPGDVAAAIRFEPQASWTGASLPEIPVTMRTLIPLGPTGGDFSGTLTGGNGRALVGPTMTYEFNVPNGVDNLSLNLDIPDNGYLLEGLLIDPQGMELSVQDNIDPFGNVQYGLQLFRAHPQSGTWRLLLQQDYFSSGNQTSLPFTARIGFNTAQVTAIGLPNSDSQTLSARAGPVTIPIQVFNTGAVTEAYFADARLKTFVPMPLVPLSACAPATLPGACTQVEVPTEVQSIQFIAQSSAPIEMDAFNFAGFFVGQTSAPDIFAKRVARGTVVASIAEPEVPYGPWAIFPALIGPYGPAGAPSTPVSTGAVAVMQPFDPAVSASSGDIWADLTLGTNTYNPLLLAPGEGGIINLTITPNPADVGKAIRGYLYIDTYNSFVSTGDEVVRIPYSYTIAP
jgi:hypothetical protein